MFSNARFAHRAVDSSEQSDHSASLAVHLGVLQVRPHFDDLCCFGFHRVSIQTTIPPQPDKHVEQECYCGHCSKYLISGSHPNDDVDVEE